jgi:Bacteriophage HK97-gp10, putative tail-component
MSFDVKISNDRAFLKLDKVEPATLDELREAALSIKTRLVALAKSAAPVRTGAYRKSIRGSVRKSTHGVKGKVFSSSRLAHIIEGGAVIPAHDIRPSEALALHFGGGAGEVFAARVHSPGATLRAQQVIENAFEEMQQDIVAELTAAAKRGAAEAGS